MRESGPILFFTTDPSTMRDDVPSVIYVSYAENRNELTFHDSGGDWVLPVPTACTCATVFEWDLAAAQWQYVALQIADTYGPELMIVMDWDYPLLNFALIAYAFVLAPYVIRNPPEDFKASPANYALIGCADGIMLRDPAHKSAFQERYVGPVFAIYEQGDLLGALQGLRRDGTGGVRLNVEASAGSAPGKSALQFDPTAKADRKNAPLKILIVAYFAGECSTVGVSRVNYWAEELDRVSEGRTETYIATAFPAFPNGSSTRVHRIPDIHGLALWEAEGSQPDWAVTFIQTERGRKNIASGYYWRIALEKYFEALQENFDVVIVSGNPFAYFDFAAFAKRRWNAKVILDYRDPFANNPAFRYSSQARAEARRLERGYNYQADLILAVNPACRNLVELNDEVPIVEIPNGFDERIVAKVAREHPSGDQIHFIHVGSFTSYRSAPQPFLRSMDPVRHRVHHVGRQVGLTEEDLGQESLVLHGILSYRETMAYVAGAHCGLIFLSPHEFETTTKVFDYLAFRIDILVVAERTERSGSLWELTSHLPNVHWVKNQEQDIRAFLENYRPGEDRPDCTQAFSRRASTERLLGHIEEMFIARR